MPRKRTTQKRSVADNDLHEHVKNVAREFEALVSRIPAAQEKSHARFYYSWNTFGTTGPLLKSIIGIIVLVIAVTLLNGINVSIKSQFLTNIATFVSSNLLIFFFASLFFNYASSARDEWPHKKWLFYPFVDAVRIVFVFWIILNIAIPLEATANSTFLASALVFLNAHLIEIAVVLIVCSYARTLMQRKLNRDMP
ncbi:MAG: hypothetical protein HY832_01820 [Candidatus Aenigmarchaeota archaeon]|nr:hypothetical protein [Candidatus Aenigmarchaeota archaeon]